MVCRSVFVWSFPEILSTMHGLENFPSLTTMATRALKKALQDAISCISLVSGGTYMKDDLHYSVSCKFSESVCARISCAH